MIRTIIHIDKNKCNGCGACAAACHENAIVMLDGKAHLLRDDYCDGLGDCLPHCPTNAITFEKRDTAAYDEQAVHAHQKALLTSHQHTCSGQTPRSLGQTKNTATSQLRQWPVQIKLAPVTAPYFDKASLLIAADCTAYAYARFHEDFMSGKITLIGCPKLDNIDYSENLTAIFKQNTIKDITVIRMEVPCCGGLESAVKKAVQQSGTAISCQVITLCMDGTIR
jgi:ferredoxin